MRNQNTNLAYQITPGYADFNSDSKVIILPNTRHKSHTKQKYVKVSKRFMTVLAESVVILTVLTIGLGILTFSMDKTIVEYHSTISMIEHSEGAFKQKGQLTNITGNYVTFVTTDNKTITFNLPTEVIDTLNMDSTYVLSLKEDNSLITLRALN